MKLKTTHALWLNCLCIASFATFLILDVLYRANSSALSDFSTLYISQATLDNISVGNRVSLYLKLLGLAGISLPLLTIGLRKIVEKYSVTAKQLLPFSLLSLLGVNVVLVQQMGGESRVGINFSCAFFVYLLLLFLLQKKLSARWNSRNFFLIALHPASFLLTIFVLLSVQFLCNSSEFIFASGRSPFFLLHALTAFTLFQIKQRAGYSFRKVFFVALPLSLFPLLVFFAVEIGIYQRITANWFVSVKWIFILLSVGSCGVFWLFARMKKKRYSTQQLTNYIFGFFAVLGCVLFVSYRPFFEQPTELFELANSANAQLKLFRFHELPLIDFMSSHLLSEQFYGVIYHLIFGYSGSLDFLAYSFMYMLIFSAVVYFFLVKLFKSGTYAFLFLLVYPYLGAFINGHLIISVVLLHQSHRVIHAQTVRNYTVLFLLIPALLAWRLDTGVASLTALACFLPLYFYSTKTRFLFQPFFRALILVVVFFSLLFIGAIATSGMHYILGNITQALHYISANQAHGYSSVATQFTQQFYSFHLIFPLLALVGIVVGSYILRNVERTNNTFSRKGLLTAMFLFFVYLANYQRGIVRHGFMEGNDSIIAALFFLALTLFILSLFTQLTSSQRFIGFFGLGFFTVFFLSYFPVNTTAAMANELLQNPSIRKLDASLTRENFQGRISKNEAFERETYRELRIFLDKHLRATQTFLDFSNTPMLYYYCQRNVPSYFCQNQQNTIDDYLQLEQLKRAPLSDVPVVVFSNAPKTWFDATDGVPSEMRYYLLAQHIFKHYKPYGVIGNHSVWCLKSKPITASTPVPDTLVNIPQTFDYKKAAPIVFKHFTLKNTKALRILETAKPHRMKNGHYHCAIRPFTARQEGVFLSLTFKDVHENERVNIAIYHHHQCIGKVDFTLQANEKNYMVPLSNHYFWHSRYATHLEILTSPSSPIKRTRLYKDLRYEH